MRGQGREIWRIRIRSKRRGCKWRQRKGGGVLLTAPLTRLLMPRSAPQQPHSSPTRRGNSLKPNELHHGLIFHFKGLSREQPSLCVLRTAFNRWAEFFHSRGISHRMAHRRGTSPPVAFSLWSYCTFHSTLGNQTIATIMNKAYHRGFQRDRTQSQQTLKITV